MVRVTRQGIQWIDMVGFVAHKVIYIRIVWILLSSWEMGSDSSSFSHGSLGFVVDS